LRGRNSDAEWIGSARPLQAIGAIGKMTIGCSVFITGNTIIIFGCHFKIQQLSFDIFNGFAGIGTHCDALVKGKIVIAKIDLCGYRCIQCEVFFIAGIAGTMQGIPSRFIINIIWITGPDSIYNNLIVCILSTQLMEAVKTCVLLAAIV
jgi:hypothetical protein